MRSNTRQRVRVLYEYRCGYCGVRESDAGARLTLDHFRPRSQGGNDDLDNLVYCCHACNEFKGDYWRDEEDQRLLHPLQDDSAPHYAQSEDGNLRGLTTRGINHIAQLRLNRPELIAHRLQQRNEEALNTENRQMLALLEKLRNDNESLRDQIASRKLSRKRG